MSFDGCAHKTLRKRLRLRVFASAQPDVLGEVKVRRRKGAMGQGEPLRGRGAIAMWGVRRDDVGVDGGDSRRLESASLAFRNALHREVIQ
jgi:hypothetical protein